MKRTIYGCFIAIALLNLGVLLCLSATLPQIPYVTIDRPQRMLVIAPHVDDCVIGAGGAAIQNSKAGGKIWVAYVTKDSDPVLAEQRRAEAHRVWALLPRAVEELTFLDYDDDRQRTAGQEDSVRADIRHLLLRVGPDVVYGPLFEGGHEIHDRVNTIVRSVLDEPEFRNVRLVQSALYNPYFLPAEHPEKLLSFVARLLPFIDFDRPNAGLLRHSQRKLKMTDDELQLKRRMLSGFVSQRDVIPLSQFGFEDIYESTSTPPGGTVRLGKKHLTPWAVATLLSLLAALFSASALGTDYLYRRTGGYIPLGHPAVTMLLLAGAATPAYVSIESLQEDFLFVIPVCLGALIEALRLRRRCNAHTALSPTASGTARSAAMGSKNSFSPACSAAYIEKQPAFRSTSR